MPSPTPFRSIAVVLALAAAGCSTTRRKPCSNAGDTSWYPPIRGNMECYQKIREGNELVDHGKFRQWYESGKLALEGEFDEGLKTGLWIQYDEKGNRVAEKWFENGVERTMPPEVQRSMPRPMQRWERK